MKRYAFFINPVAETYAYCLMPNHLHLLVKIKDTKQLQEAFQKKKQTDDELKSEDIPNFISREFGSLFSSYTQAFNKQQQRRGSLFIPNFKRKLVDSDKYFTQIVHYIHANPVKHGFVRDLAEWKYSSFLSFISIQNTSLRRDEVLKWFGDIEQYLKFHKENQTNFLMDFE